MASPEFPDYSAQRDELGLMQFAQKYQADLVHLTIENTSQLSETQLEDYLINLINTALDKKAPNLISDEPLQWEDIFPDSDDPEILSNRAELIFSEVSKHIPPKVLRKIHQLAEKEEPEQTEEIPKLVEEISEEVSKTPSGQNLLKQSKACLNNNTIDQITQRWYKRQIGVEIEDLPIQTQIHLQGLPSTDDLKNPRNKLKIGKLLLCATACINPALALLIIGGIIARKMFIKKTRSPEGRENAFKKAYGADFNPNKPPWNKQIAKEILEAGIDLAAKPTNQGHPSQELAILGMCSNLKENWTTSSKAIKKLASEGYTNLSLDLPHNLSKDSLQELKDFRERTQNTPPRDLLKTAQAFAGENAQPEWCLALAQASLASQLGLRTILNGPPSEQELKLEKALKDLKNKEGITGESIEFDKISTVYGGPLKAANLEMAKREALLEKTQFTAKALLEYEGEKTIHICKSEQTFSLQDLTAELTGVRPWGLQIQNRHLKSPWSPWGTDNPENSDNTEPLTPANLLEVLDKFKTPKHNRFHEFE